MLVANARIEVAPSDGVFERIRAEVPRELALSVTCLAAHGPDRAVDLAVRLARAGYRVMPHLAAHAIAGREHLRGLLDRCAAAGIAEFLVVGGDLAQCAGPYEWAGALLQDVLEVLPGAQVSVTGYPQGHPRYSDADLREALLRKCRLGAAAVVTQMCFDPRAHAAWLADLQELGVSVPVWLGCPGVVRRSRVARMARRIGVSEAMRFARGNRRAVVRLMLSRHFRPDHLIDEVLSDELHAAAFAGVHLYSFNDIARTVAWRQGYLRRATPVPSHRHRR